jgi:hypothetical protein
MDGKAIARLSRDARGGVFELFDDRQQVAARVSAGAIGPGRPPREAYVLDEDDPFIGRAPGRPSWQGDRY